MTAEHVDVLIIGAGISGIGAAYYLQERCPRHSYAILEGRANLGGTWDLFRYPGIRSDSDMFTLGYRFKPWKDPKAIADGASILAYLEETAREYGIDRRIRFGHRVTAARWSSSEAKWTVEVSRADGTSHTFTCGFMFMCAGYYDYERGHSPEFAGAEDFRGRIVHPQHWTDDIDYEGKRVVVIGSGATAVTLVPELAKRAAHVTMLQRSPTYVLPAPAVDPHAKWLHERLPPAAAYSVTRWKKILFSMGLYQFCRRFPGRARRFVQDIIRSQLPEGYDVDTHFQPEYDPWDQRLCMAADGDLFQAIRSEKASVETDQIERFTASGLRLASGKELEADLVVTATGLRIKLYGGIALEIDGTPFSPQDHIAYKGLMLSDVPNMAFASGYTNASWTLKVELSCEFVCRLLNRMKSRGYDICVPRCGNDGAGAEPILDLKAGYILRALDEMPKQGSKAPWRLYQNYLLDALTLRHRPLNDGRLELLRRPG